MVNCVNGDVMFTAYRVINEHIFLKSGFKAHYEIIIHTISEAACEIRINYVFELTIPDTIRRES